MYKLEYQVEAAPVDAVHQAKDQPGLLTLSPLWGLARSSRLCLWVGRASAAGC